MKRFPRTALWLATAAAFAALSGCAPGNVKVTGKLTKGGAPVPPPPKSHIEIKLIPQEAGEHYTTKVGIVDDNGSFEILDVPTGRYKIAVTGLANPTDPASDALGGAFNDQNTKIVREIDGKPLNIDLNKPEG